jgi:hypothetical protein
MNMTKQDTGVSMIHIHDQGDDGWLLIEMDAVRDRKHARMFRLIEWYSTREMAEERKAAIEASRKA